MREILFKGKRADNGKLVVGNSVLFFKDTTKIYGELTYWREIEVIPETVGQFTGLTDKNGKKIFEGDIVESPHGTRGVVEWHGAECAFLVNIGDDWQTMDDCTYEVIGNIYDNKEEEE